MRKRDWLMFIAGYALMLSVWELSLQRWGQAAFALLIAGVGLWAGQRTGAIPED